MKNVFLTLDVPIHGGSTYLFTSLTICPSNSGEFNILGTLRGFFFPQDLLQIFSKVHKTPRP